MSALIAHARSAAAVARTSAPRWRCPVRWPPRRSRRRLRRSAQVPPVTPPVVTPPAPDPQAIVSTPSRRTLYKEGPSGRYLVDGPWLFRADPAGNGDLQGWQRDPATTGWTQTTVPNAWNATDESEASYAGAIGWYRKDFRLPERASG